MCAKGRCHHGLQLVPAFNSRTYCASQKDSQLSLAENDDKRTLSRPDEPPMIYDMTTQYGFGRMEVRKIEIDTALAYIESDGKGLSHLYPTYWGQFSGLIITVINAK